MEEYFKSIILCADDYGYTDQICQAILSLLQKQRLSAVSSMTNMPLWKTYAPALKDYRFHCDLGLHFNLTEGYSLITQRPFPPLHQWFLEGISRKLDQQWITNELQAQLEQFEKYIGQPPDFIDGHQHIHHFPMIRDALLKVCQQRFKTKKPYIRISSNGWLNPFSIKHLLITLTGALRLKKKLKQLKIPHNHSFSGVYDFSNKIEYRTRFRHFSSQISSSGIIMCHPGLNNTRDNESDKDTIAHARLFEYLYLSSEQFLQDCQEYSLRLTRF